MSEFDLIIRGGTVATASDVFRADIGITGGKIVQIGERLGGGAEVVAADGKFVLPGGIDSHVHFSQPSGPGIVMADDFESGTRSALFGGNTTVMPFCLQQKGVPLRESLNAYHALAEGNCYTDVSFHLILSDASESILGQDLPALVADGYSSLKVFMTYEGLRLSDGEIIRTLDVARSTGATVMVHCENEDAIRFLIARHEAAGDVAPRAHASTRPVAVEREATHRALTLAEIADVPVVIVHVSNGAAIEEIARARTRGVKVIGETCPQYLMLTADDLDGMNWEGAKFVCSPPPRDKNEQIACWRGIETGIFDLYSSDHCPFRYDDVHGKLNPRGRASFRHIPNGIPGVETRLPILFSEGVVKGRIDLPRFVALTSTNHAKTYGLYPQKGTITVGADADLAIWDPTVTRRIRHADLHDGADYTPYEGMDVTGWPTTVVLGGRVMIRDGELVGHKGDGAYRPASIRRSAASPASMEKQGQ
ncbi:dihydropyrimidinase [Xanthobacteraceae bacterium Astr-EGSB]|uniref:dihydropyrimidinase n=1 Tax=Astrobacterium formosum TaxID=3069710 RepID=UPI0027B2F562|nr:dihydropyrimidinase [Xanthobacteraceae bacterium Astr-EGSB]